LAHTNGNAAASPPTLAVLIFLERAVIHSSEQSTVESRGRGEWIFLHHL
jgi:hypothetical protein